MALRIRVLTSLYPAEETPFEGIFAAQKWQRMAQRGHAIDVVVPLPWAPRAAARWLPQAYARMARTARAETRSGIPVYRPRYLHVPSRALGNARRFARVGVDAVLAPSRERPDVVVCDYAWPAAAAVPRLTERGIPVVVNGRGSDVLQVAGIDGLAPELARGLAAARGVTAVSQDLLDTMVTLRGSERGAALTPNGVDTERFSPGDRAEARAAVGEEAAGRLVLVVGHLIERKDPLLALAAFAASGLADARLVFVGRGPLQAAVLERAQELGVQDRVRLLGERPPDELRNWYRAADVLVLTSTREGRPNVVLEALASGCPVLATEAGGTAEVVSSTRMLARTRSAPDLGVMLRSLIESPPAPEDLAAVVRPLTWDASLDALTGVLTELVGSAESGAESR